VDEGLLFVVAGAWVLSPVALGILLGIEARKRRRIEGGLEVVQGKLARLERQLARVAAAPDPDPDPDLDLDPDPDRPLTPPLAPG
jgi:hypothetical protein